MTLLGIDYGLKKIGIAVSDQRQSFALPVTTLYCNSTDEALAGIASYITEYQPVGIVLGMPRFASGEASPQGAATEAFRDALAKAFALPIYCVDERMSTQGAQRLRTGMTGDEDATAAMLILQTYLDQQRLA